MQGSGFGIISDVLWCSQSFQCANHRIYMGQHSLLCCNDIIHYHSISVCDRQQCTRTLPSTRCILCKTSTFLAISSPRCCFVNDSTSLISVRQNFANGPTNLHCNVALIDIPKDRTTIQTLTHGFQITVGKIKLC